MLDLNGVCDAPALFGRRVPLLDGVDLALPVGRYALLSPKPEYHRALIDVLAGLRPPDRGAVRHCGRVSWPVGRSGFVRSRCRGQDLIELVSALHGLDPDRVAEVVAILVSRPDYLDRPVEQWPAYVRQEFTFALALAPDFDIYVIDAPIPFEPSRFSRLWQAMFEERLVGKTLIFTTYRHNQLLDYCAKALVHENGRLWIEDDLEICIKRYPSRPSREELAGDSSTGISDGAGDLSF